MPYRLSRCEGGYVYHVINRATRGQVLFHDASTYILFLRTLREAREIIPMRMLAYCLMPNHIHLLFWPAADGELSLFMKWTLMTHAKRLHRERGTEGRGAVYQSRSKAVPVFGEASFYRVARYIERNPVRAGLVDHPDEWPWSSAGSDHTVRLVISSWPVARPDDWSHYIDASEAADELDDLRRRLARRLPIGPKQPSLALPADFALREPGKF